MPTATATRGPSSESSDSGSGSGAGAGSAATAAAPPAVLSAAPSHVGSSSSLPLTARRRSHDATAAEGSPSAAAAATAGVAAAASSASPATSNAASPLSPGYSAAAMAAVAASAAQSIAAVARSSSSSSPASGAGAGASTPAALVAALASAGSARSSAQASASMFNLTELLETVKTMSAGRVFTGYFANQSLQEPIKQDLFVFFDCPLPQTAEPTPAPAPSAGPNGKAPTSTSAAAGTKKDGITAAASGSAAAADTKKGASAASTPTSTSVAAPSTPVSIPALSPSPDSLPPCLSGGVLYWSVVGRDGSLHRSRSGDLSLAVSEIEDIYLGKRTTAFTLPFAAAAREECCFSLIARNRTHMNFEAKTPVTLVSWLLGLKRLVQANKKLMEPAPPAAAAPVSVATTPTSSNGTASGSALAATSASTPSSGSRAGSPPAGAGLSGSASSPPNNSSSSTLDIHDVNQASLRREIWQTIQQGIQQGVQLFQAAIAQQKAQNAAAAAAATPKPASSQQPQQPQQSQQPKQPQAQPKQPPTQPSQPQPQKQQKPGSGSGGGFLSNLLGGKHNNRPQQQQQPQQKQQQQLQQQAQPQSQPSGAASKTPGARSLTAKSLQQNNPSQMAAAAFVAAANAQHRGAQAPQHVRSRSSALPSTSAVSSGGGNGTGTGTPLNLFPAAEAAAVDPLQLFQILGRIGQGNYGYVYKARDLRDNQLVAIKIVETDSAASSAELSAEISILAQCHSRNIVAYKGTFVRGSPAAAAVAAAAGVEKKYSPNSTLIINPQQVWIVMEYCVAGSLCDLMAITDRVLSEEQVAAVLKMSLQGLAYFHSLNHLHRDIKAGNILLNHEGIAKLSDFGVSAQLSASVSKRKTVTGSPYWMAPEVMTSSSPSSTGGAGAGSTSGSSAPYNQKADIWSLGATAIELATGDPPNHEIHPLKALFAIPSLPPPRLPREYPDGTPRTWSASFADFVALCLEKDPEKRPTALQLLEKHPFITRAPGPALIKQLVAECMPEIDKYREIEARMANKVSFNRARGASFGGGAAAAGEYSDSESSVSRSGHRSVSRSWWHEGGHPMRNAQSISDLRGMAAAGGGSSSNARSPQAQAQVQSQAPMGGYASQRASMWEKELSRSERDRDRVRREREWEQELSRGGGGRGGMGAQGGEEESLRSQSPSFSYSDRGLGGGGGGGAGAGAGGPAGGGNHLGLPMPWHHPNGSSSGISPREPASRGNHLPRLNVPPRSIGGGGSGGGGEGSGGHLASYDSAGLALYEGQSGDGDAQSPEESVSFSTSQSHLYLQNRYGTASSTNGGLPFFYARGGGGTGGSGGSGGSGGDGGGGAAQTASTDSSDDKLDHVYALDTPERAADLRRLNVSGAGAGAGAGAALASGASPSFNTLYRKAAVEAVRHAQSGDFYSRPSPRSRCQDERDGDGDDNDNEYDECGDEERERERRSAFLVYDPVPIPQALPLSRPHSGVPAAAATNAGSVVWEYATGTTEATSAESFSGDSGSGDLVPLPPVRVPSLEGSKRSIYTAESPPSSASNSRRASPSPVVSQGGRGSVAGSHERQGSASTSLTAALSALQPFSLATASPAGPLPAPAALVANVPPLFVGVNHAPSAARSHAAAGTAGGDASLGSQYPPHPSPSASPSEVSPPHLHEAPPSPTH